MTDIKFTLSEPINEYCSGKISEQQFKHKVQEVENFSDGANWWTICTGIWNEADRSCHGKLIEPIHDLYGDEELVRILPKDLLDNVE